MDMLEIVDFTDLTCTNLMIKLKILLSKQVKGESLKFYATREQVDNTCSQFASQNYCVHWAQAGENQYLVQMKR